MNSGRITIRGQEEDRCMDYVTGGGSSFMNEKDFSRPLSLKQLEITDPFWRKEMELVRGEMLPYQWEALNDRVKDAAPSFCIRNFQVAARINSKRRSQGRAYEEPVYTDRGFEALPEDGEDLKEQFYGFVFQDSDLYKWIEAVAYNLAQRPDPELESLADFAVDLICAAQQEDGYLDCYYIINGRDRIFTNLRDHHELYCFGHLAEAAVAYDQATGKEKLLKAAMNFADYIDRFFGPGLGKSKGYPGHEIAEMALARLYEATGEERYLRLGRFFIDQRGTRPYYFDEEHPEAVKKGKEEELRYMYHQAHLPVRQQKEAVGHAVRAVYLYSGMADMARLTGDSSLYEACERVWHSMVHEKMYITGGIGATHLGEAFSFPYDLPNDTAYAETCASVGLVFFAARMLRLCPDGKYADVMERALYNGILSGMSLDGKSFFYVNPLEVAPEACRKDERKAHVKPVRPKWFGCACCPPNLARLLSSLGSYAYTEREDTLFIHLYLGGILHKRVKGQEVEVIIESGFPWKGAVRIQVKGAVEPFTLALRIPKWGRDYRMEGGKLLHKQEKNGYLYVTGDFSGENSLRLDFPMEARLVAASPLVRQDIGRAAVMAGPLVYCLEEADNGKNLHLLSIPEDASFQAEDFQIAGVCVKSLTTEGFRQIPEEKEGLYHTLHRTRREPVKLSFIPYFAWANRGENEMQVWTRLDTLH